MAQTRETKLFRDGAEPLNCTSCGSLLPARVRYSKLVVCENCRSILYLHDGTVGKLGDQAALAEHPSLFRLNHRFVYRNRMLEPVGMLRYGYGRGFWEEWWCLGDSGAGRWVSVDEGDFVLEEKREATGVLPQRDSLSIGGRVKLMGAEWAVTELGEARLEGMQGQLPELVKPNRSFHYAHLERPGRRLITLEYEAPDEPPDLYMGEWMDPFEIAEL